MDKNGFTKMSLIILLGIITAGCNRPVPAKFNWSQLPAIPDSVGFAGSFSGTSSGALIVAGGANFPDGGAPWSGSTKVWHDDIFVLENTEGKWLRAGKLPAPLGYGVSISWKDALVCIGGSNASGHFAEAFMLRYKDRAVQVQKLPDLPASLANSCGVLMGDVVYVAGGQINASDQVASANFWSLDLSTPEKGWQDLPTWPGLPRMLAVAGTANGAFYLFSGVALKAGKREYLKDAFKYVPDKGWEKIKDLPAAVVAAPSPAYGFEGNSLQIFGGDDGALAAKAADLKANHPGFSKDILSYDILTNDWTVAGQIATLKKEDAIENPNHSIWAPVTTPLVVWNGNIVLPGGEVRPATRTPNVLIVNVEEAIAK